jgi:hypothetical protein
MSAEIIQFAAAARQPLAARQPARAKRSVEQWERNTNGRQERSQAFNRLKAFEVFRLTRFKLAVATKIAALEGCEVAKSLDVEFEKHEILHSMWRESLVAALLQPCGYVSEATWKDQKLRRFKKLVDDPDKVRAVIAADEAFIKAHPVRGGSHGRGGRPKAVENDPDASDELPGGFDSKKFAARLRAAREGLGITELEAARAAGVSLQTWQTYERVGRGRITQPLLNFREQYNLNLDELFD